MRHPTIDTTQHNQENVIQIAGLWSGQGNRSTERVVMGSHYI